VTRVEERRLPLRLSNDEQQLQKVVRDFLTSVVPPPSGANAAWADLDPDGRFWRRLTNELGLQGLAVPDELGGQGFGLAELAVVFHELGRVTCAAPLFGSMALAGRLLAHLPGGVERDRVLTGIADGSLRASAVVDAEVAVEAGTLTGTATAVIDAPVADVLIVVAGTAVYSVAAAAPGVRIDRQDGLDLTRELGRVELREGHATLLAADAADAIQRGRAEATVLLSAELTGVAEAALAEAVGYSKIRTQFGRQIGSFQSLKHRMADILVATEGAWSTSRHAALLGDATGPSASADELALAAGVAKAAASTAATFATGENIQIHGGIGFTWEHPAHLRFRRARSGSVLLGSPAAHRVRVAAALTRGSS
jgi:alkylation response protein AidB-like acyl-CoA dehydrogenase